MPQEMAGQRVPVVNRLTGEVHEAGIFIAVLGASNYTYAVATWSQNLPDWIGSNNSTLPYTIKHRLALHDSKILQDMTIRALPP